MKTILIVDDEAKIREVVASYLRKEGYLTIEAGSGSEALELAEKGNLDFIILDLMLPDISGEEVCRRVRRFSPIPVLMLTAKSSGTSKINGLSLGADDYLVKPFDPNELTARVRAILRRSGGDTLLADRISFQEDRLVLDIPGQKVYVSGEKVSLTPNEFRLLVVMARHPQRVFSRAELVEKVLGFDFEGDERTIDQHVKNLRQKIERDPREPFFLVTVFGKGYRFQGG
ncbi:MULTISPECIES: response regulator transcription factor [unclassified Paenibacillus]|uniref:response regulator transcription factor n=1 Tax=unclassified Paenibacillus TaxID=185978 RepID=UPI001AE7869F|nr:MULTISPECIES: response regulator transcription factor [unclassified Paenibacillus]MBP1154664.1 DNA-binding response OmpR family regulator [Paenibacillus sp. PvP091]MBP1169952.1 DNA-binding response OmpR family regulator [Paenibacillus sp. PvR098]MBP2440980.1 DNA-binding response OmpR family regulator [Paenibacillus sp. PvP052]